MILKTRIVKDKAKDVLFTYFPLGILTHDSYAVKISEGEIELRPASIDDIVGVSKCIHSSTNRKRITILQNQIPADIYIYDMVGEYHYEVEDETIYLTKI